MDCLHPEFEHIAGKDNPVADMLSRARYEDEEGMISDNDDVGTKFYTIAHAKGDHACLCQMHLSLSLRTCMKGIGFLLANT